MKDVLILGQIKKKGKQAMEREIKNWEDEKENLMLQAIPMCANISSDYILKNVENTDIRCVVSLENKDDICPVTEDMLKKWDKTQEEVCEIATKNTATHTTIKNLMEIFSELPELLSDANMCVVSSGYKCGGAGAFIPEVMEKFAKENQQNPFVIQPSSIHESLYVPIYDYSEDSAKYLDEMVSAVNKQEVKENEWASNNSYTYDPATKELGKTTEMFSKIRLRTKDVTEEKKADKNKSIVNEDFTGHEYTNEVEQDEREV